MAVYGYNRFDFNELFLLCKEYLKRNNYKEVMAICENGLSRSSKSDYTIYNAFAVIYLCSAIMFDRKKHNPKNDKKERFLNGSLFIQLEGDNYHG